MTTLLGGKYVLDRRLGGGGMAEVFLGRTVGAAGFSRQVAIKRILPGYSDNPAFAEMFISEARLTAKLRHPNVVSILDFDQDSERRLFLVLELVDGTDLHGLIETGPLPFSAIVFVTTEVLRGLGYAHDLPVDADGMRGLVHRDVSPHNVLLSWEGEVKVSDFGIAKARAATAATGSVLIKGKPAYMSPEQANGAPLDGTSDLFAVGVMLWEMLSGQPLFATETLESTLARVMFAPIVRPGELRHDVPADLERVALRLLERDRSRRYPSAAAAIADLVACADNPRNGREELATLLAERFVGRAPRRARSAVSTSPEAATITPGAPAPRAARPLPGPVDPSTVSPPAAPRRWPMVAVVLLALAAATVGVVLALGGTESEVREAARPASGSDDAPAEPAPRAQPAPAPSQSVGSVDAPAMAAPGAPGASPDDPRPSASATREPASPTVADDHAAPTTERPELSREPAAGPHDRTRTSPRKKSSRSRIEEIRLGGASSN